MSPVDPAQVSLVETDPGSAVARDCLRAYYAELNTRFDRGFDVRSSLDPEEDSLRPPKGCFLVARAQTRALGCVALKGNGTETGEIKRLWVAPHARGLGLARRLMQAAEARARTLGMTRLRLDTNRNLDEAIALYRAKGWTEVAAFNTEPYAHHWFEKRL